MFETLNEYDNFSTLCAEIYLMPQTLKGGDVKTSREVEHRLVHADRLKVCMDEHLILIPVVE